MDELFISRRERDLAKMRPVLEHITQAVRLSREGQPVSAGFQLGVAFQRLCSVRFADETRERFLKLLSSVEDAVTIAHFSRSREESAPMRSRMTQL